MRSSVESWWLAAYFAVASGVLGSGRGPNCEERALGGAAARSAGFRGGLETGRGTAATRAERTGARPARIRGEPTARRGLRGRCPRAAGRPGLARHRPGGAGRPLLRRRGRLGGGPAGTRAGGGPGPAGQRGPGLPDRGGLAAGRTGERRVLRAHGVAADALAGPGRAGRRGPAAAAAAGRG